MSRPILAWLGALLIAVCVGGAALAHTRSESHSDWTVDGRNLSLTFTLADLEAQRIAPGGPPPSDADLARYLTSRITVTAGKAACPPSRPARAVLAVAGFRRFELAFACPAAEAIALHTDVLFDVAPTHVNIAQIQTTGGDFVQELVTKDAHDVDLGEAGGKRLEGAGFLDFVRMGVMHIFTGVDHMSFLVGLVLISRRLRDLTFVVTGFTLGHSLTLALAVTGVVRPHAEYIDALVALTIALIGVENIGLASRRPGLVAAWCGGALLLMMLLRLVGVGRLPPLLLLGAGMFSASYLLISGQLRDAGRLRLVVSLIFGLIHGFGFAADLLESPIPRARLAELLFGFNLGVEIGQLTLVLAVSGVVYLLVTRKLALPRPIVVDVAASALVAVGVYWFVGRSFV